MTGAKKNFHYDSEKMIQNMIQRRTEYRLDEIKKYYEEIEGKFQTEKKRLAKAYEAKVASTKMDEDTKYEIDEYFSEEHYEIENIFLKNLRYSAVVSVYSFLEVALNDLCAYLKRAMGLLLDLGDLTGDGIMRAKVFLIKVCKVDFPEKSNEWQEIMKLNLVRNCIVHTQGDVRCVSSPTKLKDVVRNTKGLKIDNDIFLLIDSSYIVTAIENSGQLLDMVYEKVFAQLKVLKKDNDGAAGKGN